jgi:DNA polymerase-3 subunit delta
MFYLLHGDDEFTNHEHLKKLRHEGNFAYNEDIYNGAETDLVTITTTSSTYPFLAEQRLVVVEGLPKKRRGEESAVQAPAGVAVGEAGSRGGKTRKGKRAGKGGALSRAGFEKGLAECIPSVPDTTVLVVLVDEVLDASSPLLKAAKTHGTVIQSTLPRGAALESWIGKRAKSIGVTIRPDAAAMLANFIGSQLRLLANELDKLAMYAGERAVITMDDVRKLSAQVQEARVFDLTDALAQRNQKQALDILHDLLADGEAPLRLISTITSQVRSLLLVKELSQKGMRAAEIASTAGLSPFVAEKALRQVGKFTVSQLENSYRQLLATDAALKRSRMTPEMALDLLVVDFGSSAVRT